MDVSAYCPRGSSERITAWLKFALYEAFLFTPLHPELLNFKLLRRPQSLAQELPGLEGESIAMTQAPLRKSSLLSKRAGEYLLSWTWWEQALLCRWRLPSCFCLWLGLLAEFNTFQHQGVIFVSQLALGCPVLWSTKMFIHNGTASNFPFL